MPLLESDTLAVRRELERILPSQLDWNVRFEHLTIKQEVIVVTGDWNQTPLPGAENPSWIYLTVAAVPDPKSGGGGSGSLDDLFGWLGDSIRIRFVNEVSTPPTDALIWSDQLGKLRNHMRETTPESEKALVRLLENFVRQTGLSFKAEERSVDVWRIVAE